MSVITIELLGGKGGVTEYEMRITAAGMRELMARRGGVLGWDFGNLDLLCDVIAVSIRHQVDKKPTPEWVAGRFPLDRLLDIGKLVNKAVFDACGITRALDEAKGAESDDEEGSGDPEA